MVKFKYFKTLTAYNNYEGTIANDDIVFIEGANLLITHGNTYNFSSGTDSDTTYKLTIGSTTYGDSTNGVSLGTLDSLDASSSGTDLSLVTTGEKSIWNNISYVLSSGTATTVNGIASNKSKFIVTIANGQTALAFKISARPGNGKEIHYIIDNRSNSSDLTITIPHGTVSSIDYVNTVDCASGSMTVSAGGIGEINILVASSKVWIRYVNA